LTNSTKQTNLNTGERQENLATIT